MSINYIIVQAGGKGTRLKHLTVNRPKALVSVHGKPILFHLFDSFPDAHFIIIGDYKIDVLRSYLKAFATVQYDIVDGRGYAKTCAGLQNALRHIPDNAPFMYIWSDLVLPSDFEMPAPNNNYIGISHDFCCRWKYENGKIEEIPSENNGIAGMFIFTDKNNLNDVPLEGAFVRWLSTKNIQFKELKLINAHEYGLLEEYYKIQLSYCRPFNKVIIEDTTVTKIGIDDFGKKLSEYETAWYQAASAYGIDCTPKIHSLSPLVMERIEGKHPFELPQNIKKTALANVLAALKTLHAAEACPIDEESLYENYIAKTFARLEKVRHLIPLAEKQFITVNGVSCPNPLHSRARLESLLQSHKPARFCFIHGDCTFSNTLARPDGSIVFIDPRGYFGQIRLFGDPAYDYAKLYYSLVGNYDQFNRRQFRLTIHEDAVELQIDSNGWEDFEEQFWQALPKEISKEQILYLHGIIWLSLTTYAWDDYDSICGAFYNGARILAEAGL